MKVTCPNCKTLYELPDGKLQKPRIKMRCSRCQHGFYFTVPKPPPAAQPAEFEEFSESQMNIPAEFSDIRKAEAFEEFNESQTNISAEFDRSNQANAAPGAPPPHPPAAGGPVEIDSVMETGERPEPYGTVPDIYDDSSTSWELSSSLIIEDAEQFDIPTTQESKAARIAGRVILGIVVSMIAFFVFVALQNNWSLSFDTLPEQVAGAFSAGPVEKLPESVRGLELVVLEKKEIEGAHPKLSIHGEVINHSGTQRSQILIRGQLRDLTDAVVGEVKAPCGVVVTDDELQDSAPSEHRKHYVKAGTMHNCALNIDGKTMFQVVFDKLPANYKPGRYNATVHVISAM